MCVWLSALPAVVWATSSVLSPAPWCLPLRLTASMLPSPPLLAPTVWSLTLLAPDRAFSGTAHTHPIGKLARGARWNRNRFWWLDYKSHLWILNQAAAACLWNCFIVCVNVFVCICIYTSARRPVGQEWWSAEWSVWPPKVICQNTAVLQKDLSLKLHAKTENVSQTHFFSPFLSM